MHIPVPAMAIIINSESHARRVALRPALPGHRTMRARGGGLRECPISRQAGRRPSAVLTLQRSLNPAGVLEHHVTVGVRRKGMPTYTQVHGGQVDGSLACHLDVLRAERVAVGPAARALGWPAHAWESLLRLGTGRTHQVRCPTF